MGKWTKKEILLNLHLARVNFLILKLHVARELTSWFGKITQHESR